jgi:hypothetical protein
VVGEEARHHEDRRRQALSSEPLLTFLRLPSELQQLPLHCDRADSEHIYNCERNIETRNQLDARKLKLQLAQLQALKLRIRSRAGLVRVHDETMSGLHWLCGETTDLDTRYLVSRYLS